MHPHYKIVRAYMFTIKPPANVHTPPTRGTLPVEALHIALGVTEGAAGDLLPVLGVVKLHGPL
jgi:hypothetical protein